MNDSTRRIADSSESAGRSVNEVSTAITDVAHGNERQVASVDEARRVAEQVAAAAESGAEIAQRTAEAVETARMLASGWHQGRLLRRREAGQLGREPRRPAAVAAV